ncbi:hypothetical protein [Abyssisolibacter fermentans]|uniref:hypothetical protein n=1 Tax=Abyssisolibacter fermentans TaxID=1766203 RepID=UPI000832C8E0|nr:hypothetical protein [Abyssisolibacter fermentans]
MKKKLSFCLIAIIIAIMCISQAYACTGFAVYKNGVYYGMNFDYPQHELLFRVYSSGDMEVFSFEFEYNKGIFVPLLKMNSEGLFINVQAEYPEKKKKDIRNDDEIFTYEVNTNVETKTTCQEVRSLLEERRLINCFKTLHNLVADISGDAMIVEAGEHKNDITNIEDDFIVMSNFNNASFDGLDPDEVKGAGARRYKEAYRYISEHDSFAVDEGLELLELVSQTEHPTQASLVLDAKEKTVYISIARDYERIFKFDILKRTLESYRGFTNKVFLEIGEEGITSKTLLDIIKDDEENKENVAFIHDNLVNATVVEETVKEETTDKRKILRTIVVCVILIFVFKISRKSKNK